MWYKVNIQTPLNVKPQIMQAHHARNHAVFVFKKKDGLCLTTRLSQIISEVKCEKSHFKVS